MLSLHKDLAIILILIGGILGFLLALVALVLVLFIAGIASYGYLIVSQYGALARYGMFGYPEFGSSLMTEVMFVWSLLGLVGSVLSIYCGLTLRKKWGRNVVFTGLVGGFILLLTFSWLSSFLVLGGAILGYIKREAF